MFSFACYTNKTEQFFKTFFKNKILLAFKAHTVCCCLNQQAFHFEETVQMLTSYEPVWGLMLLWLLIFLENHLLLVTLTWLCDYFIKQSIHCILGTCLAHSPGGAAEADHMIVQRSDTRAVSSSSHRGTKQTQIHFRGAPVELICFSFQTNIN